MAAVLLGLPARGSRIYKCVRVSVSVSVRVLELVLEKGEYYYVSGERERGRS